MDTFFYTLYSGLKFRRELKTPRGTSSVWLGSSIGLYIACLVQIISDHFLRVYWSPFIMFAIGFVCVIAIYFYYSEEKISTILSQKPTFFNDVNKTEWLSIVFLITPYFLTIPAWAL